MICEEVVSIVETRLHEDLQSILHNRLTFDSSDDSTDQRLILFQSILSEVMHFDEYLRETWGIGEVPQALLIHCYQEKDIFSFWRSVDGTLYQGFVESLAGDIEGITKFQVVLNTIVNKYQHIVGTEEQKEYFIDVISPLFSIYLSNLKLTVQLSHFLLTSFQWNIFRQYVNDVDGFINVLNQFLDRTELVSLFERETEIEKNLVDVKERAYQEKKSVINSLIGTISSYYSRQVFDSVILTELFTLSDSHSFPQSRVDRTLQQAEETLTEFFDSLKQELSERLSSGIIFSTLRSIDKELKERILRLHYNRTGAENLVKSLSQIRLLSKNYSFDSMKVV